MIVELAKSAGFCFGVKKAVDTVYDAVGNSDYPIYTYGPIIHNETVTDDLKNKGVGVIRSEEELDALPEKKAAIIIRSHGVSRRILDKIEKKALKVIDATCPFVSRIHKLVEEKSHEGDHVVILGSRDHPEVEGIMGWCDGPVTVIENYTEAGGFYTSDIQNIFVVAQTTFNHKKFKELVEIFYKKGYNVTVANTICHATQERQSEAAKIASSVDTMLVIGSRDSSNTAKLYNICSELCESTYFLQTLSDLPESFPGGADKVGITAGASTPQYIIEEVYQHVGTYI